MKSIMFALLFTLLASCSSNEKVDTEAKRDVASFQADCKIVKHPTEDQYALTMYGKQYNQYWYAEDEVELLYQRFVSQGRCQ